MEDTIASTLSDAVTWIATTTATAAEEWPTDQGDVPVIGSPAGDMAGPDDSEGSYFLVSPGSKNWSIGQGNIIIFKVIQGCTVAARLL